MLAAGLLLRRAPHDGAVDAVTAARPRNAPANVVVFLVDTLRADHLGVYGYDRDTSPTIDRWAAEGVVFERAYAPSSWTRPSVVSLLSGLDPIHHGVEDRLDVVPQRIRLLSEHLRAGGYATLAAVTNPNVLPEWGLGRGFDVFDDLGAAGHGTRAGAVSEWVESRLPALAASQPFFVYLHLLDPHAPYAPPPPFDERYPRSPAFPADRSIARYDGEVAYVDSEFGRFLDALAAHDLTDDTLVIFVADHGEELMDHGNLGHGFSLFEEVVRVPLVMRLPHAARAGTRVAAPVSLVDVFPTVVGLLGLPAAPDVDGRDLGPLLAGVDDGFASRDLFLSLYTTGTRSNLVRGVVSGPRKYLRRLRPTESELLFDLDRDPAETEERAHLEPGARARMAATLDAYLARKSSGVHLRIVGSPTSEPIGCEVVLRTTGHLTDLAEVRLEAGDQVVLDDDGRTLRLACRLENRTRTFAEGDRLIPDEDGVVFRTDPPDAQIILERVRLADGRPVPVRAGVRRMHQDVPFTFDATLPDWSVHDIGEMLRDAASMRTDAEAYIGVVRSPEVRDVSGPLRDRLRSLGYLDTRVERLGP